MTLSPTHFMEEALKSAEDGLEAGEMPIGAVLVLDERIIARAYTTVQQDHRLLVHAETLALWEADQLALGAGWRSRVTLYTTLEPCLMCLGAAMSFMLGQIYYALESPSDGAVALARQWQRKEEDFPSYRLPTIEGGLLRGASLALFQAYVTRHTSGGAWEWVQALISTVGKM